MKSRFRLSRLCYAFLSLLAARSAFAQSASLDFLNGILGGAESEAAKGSERLAGGRILLADDPANYTIYRSLESQVRALGTEIGNGADMLSYYRLEDSVLGDVIDTAQSIRGLLAQRSNGALDASDRDSIDAEIGQLYDQVAETLRDAEFNQKKIFLDLDRSASARLFEDEKRFDPESLGQWLSSLIDARSAVGARIEALEFTESGKEGEILNSESGYGRGDVDFAKELVGLERIDLLVLADVLMLRRESL
jgi:hypothetical protein